SKDLTPQAGKLFFPKKKKLCFFTTSNTGTGT
ncbi:MAG: hypothetical protein ACI90V_012039, partial [Bacillariaceae sp.]